MACKKKKFIARTGVASGIQQPRSQGFSLFNSGHPKGKALKTRYVYIKDEMSSSRDEIIADILNSFEMKKKTLRVHGFFIPVWNGVTVVKTRIKSSRDEVNKQRKKIGQKYTRIKLLAQKKLIYRWCDSCKEIAIARSFHPGMKLSRMKSGIKNAESGRRLYVCDDA